MIVAGIVLCGGRSSRMGRPKAWLPVGAELMLPRVVRLVREAVGAVLVVAAPDQDVPPLPDGVRVVRDEVAGKGPLAGLAAGLAALGGEADAAYVSSCDVPLLLPEFVQRMVRSVEEPIPLAKEPPAAAGAVRGVPSIAVPCIDGQLHPLAAVYRIPVLSVVRELLAANRLRMMDLFAAVATRFVGPEELAAVDPGLRSLRNVNTPDEYLAALGELEPLRFG